MDIKALQGALRDFAAERNWQQFHSPKNLATALMVEAAELAEIFQWMTPDESRQASGHPAVKQRIGEEIADVLLYLLQVADHTGTDLQQAVQNKLLLNAQKYPPDRKVDLDRPAADTGLATHVLLDYENVQPTEKAPARKAAAKKAAARKAPVAQAAPAKKSAPKKTAAPAAK